MCLKDLPDLNSLVPHVLIPQVFYYLTIAAAVQSLMANPKFTAVRGQDRCWDDENTFIGSRHVAALNSMLHDRAVDLRLPVSSHNPLHSKNNSLFQLGDDGGNMFAGGSDSTNITCFRCVGVSNTQTRQSC